MNTPDVVGWVFGTLGVGGIATCVPLAARAFSMARLVASVPPTPLSALEPGLHEVRGSLRAREDVTAAMSERRCVWTRLLLEQRRAGRWQVLLDRRLGGMVSLVDEETRVQVDLAAADVIVASPERARAGIVPVPSEELTALLARLEGSALAEELAGPFVRWHEEELHDGDPVWVVGTARRDVDGTWALVADGGPLVVTDRDESDVIRHQRRLGRQWTLGALASLVALGLGAFFLAPTWFGTM
ncbi:MAG: Ubiquitin ligase [Pseudomonadota bacterium]|jgi:hypothetical protein